MTSTGDITLITILPRSSSEREGYVWLLPPCFFGNLTSTVTSIYMSYVAFPAASGPHSLLECGKQATDIKVLNSFLGSASFSLNWTVFFNNHPSLASLLITTSGLSGSLPASLPTSLVSFAVSSNRLTGTIPAGLLSNFTSAITIQIDLNNNALTGSVPTGLFDIQNPKSPAISFDASYNQLSGSITSGLMASTANILTLKLNNNQLSGTLPGNILVESSSSVANLFLDSNFISGSIPADLFSGASLRECTLRLNNNTLTGSLPAKLFTPLASLSAKPRMSLLVDSNKLNGSIPETLFSNGAFTSLTFNARFNQLTGALPSHLLNFSQSATAISGVSIDLRDNRLSFLSDGFFANLNAQQRLTAYIYLSDNLLTGTLSPSMFQVSDASIQTGRYATLTTLLTSNRLNGTIPPNLFSNATAFSATSFSIDVSNNTITGSIPSSLFSFGSHPHTAGTGSEASLPPFSAFTFDATNNHITGTIPEHLLSDANLTSISQLTANFGSNQISESLPTNLWDLTLPNTMTALSLNISDNAITGTIPSDVWLGKLVPTGSSTKVTLIASHNNLVGNLSSDLLTTPYFIDAFDVDLSYNSLSGDFPEKLFSGANAGILSLSLNNNKFNGTLPNDFFSSVSADISSLTVDLSNNPMSGGLDESIFSTNMATSSTLFLRARNCSLSGQISSSIIANNVNTLHVNLGNNRFTGEIDLSGLLKGVGLTLQLLLDDNLLSGTLSLPNASSASLFLNVSGNAFTDLALNASFADYAVELDISNMPGLVGTLPANILGSSIVYLDASNTSISGEVPGVNLAGVKTVQTLILHDTNINFCPTSTVLPWANDALAVCSFGENAAVGCRSSYPSMCFPKPLSPPAPSTCSKATQPNSDFQCVNGVWVYYGTVSTGSLTIPAGASQTIINGSLITTTLVFEDSTSTIYVTDCVYNLTTISIELTEEEIKKLRPGTLQLLLSYGGGNASCGDLSTVNVQATLKGSGCHKVSAKTVAAQGTLSALFSVSSSDCNRWWIILVSVIAGIIVIALIILILLIIFVPKVRYVFRPYARPREGPSAAAL